MNNDIDTINYCLKENGLNALAYIFEEVGKTEKFTREFINIIFNILELPHISDSTELRLLIPELITELVLNPKIWLHSDFTIQVF